VCFLAVSSAARAQETTILPKAEVGKPYSVTIGVETENGKGQLLWKLADGTLPPGIRVSADGKVEGTPTETKSDPYVFNLSVADSSQPPQTALLHFSLTVSAAALQIKSVKVATTQLKVVGVSATAATPIESTAQAHVAGAGEPATPTAAPAGKELPAVPAANVAPTEGPSEPATAAKPQDKPPADGKSEQKPPLDCVTDAGKTGNCGGPRLRTIVGFEQAGVSAAQSKQNFFFDLQYDRPLGFHVDSELGPALRSWGNLRISSVPQQIDSGVAQFAADFAQKAGDLKVNQVAQSFEFLGGLQYRIFPKLVSEATEYATDPPYQEKQRQVVSLNLIAGGGVITPLTPQESVEIFSVPTNQPDFFTQYPQAIGKQFVAFTLADRNRFFRQAYGGFRILTHFLGELQYIRLSGNVRRDLWIQRVGDGRKNSRRGVAAGGICSHSVCESQLDLFFRDGNFQAGRPCDQCNSIPAGSGAARHAAIEPQCRSDRNAAVGSRLLSHRIRHGLSDADQELDGAKSPSESGHQRAKLVGQERDV
jgi:hypothetical protein